MTDYEVIRTHPDTGEKETVGVWLAGPAQDSPAFANCLADWIATRTRPGTPGGSYTVRRLEPRPKRRCGRPRLPMAPLEQIFADHGITRDDIIETFGYNSAYLRGILRGKVKLSYKFMGRVLLKWPELAPQLWDYIQGLDKPEDSDGEV